MEARLGPPVGERRPLGVAPSSRTGTLPVFDGVGTCNVCRCRSDVEAGACCESWVEVVGVLGPGVAELLRAGGDENREVFMIGASRRLLVPLARGADFGADSTPFAVYLVVVWMIKPVEGGRASCIAFML